jgi:phycobilisome rod-core linker protein
MAIKRFNNVTLPLLTYSPTSRNHRVSGFEVAGDECSSLSSYTLTNGQDNVGEVIEAAYRQILNEQQMLSFNRQKLLESQLRIGSLTVREFIRGLLLSDAFRRRNYECNNNYRFAQMCIQRVLGREVYDQREKIAWSIVLATKGLEGFVDALLSSDEYLENFGEDTVPYQRRRILPQHNTGDITFAHMARYDDSHLAQLKALGNDFSADRYVPGLVRLPSPALQKVGAAITIFGAVFLSGLVFATILSWFGWLKI